MKLLELFSRKGKGSKSMNDVAYDELLIPTYGRDALISFYAGVHAIDGQYALESAAARFNVLSVSGQMLGESVVPMVTKVFHQTREGDRQTFVTCLPELQGDVTKRIHLVFEEHHTVKSDMYSNPLDMPSARTLKTIEQICMLTLTRCHGMRKIPGGYYAMLEGDHATPEAFVHFLKYTTNKSKDTP